MLRKYVRDHGCDIGLIYDGDADRVMFVDERGEFISPDLMIALMGHFFMEGTGTSPAARERAALRAAGKISWGAGSAGYPQLQGGRRVPCADGSGDAHMAGRPGIRGSKAP